jgi:hypothetical protein
VSDILGRLTSMADLMSLGGDALIELVAGIVDGIGTGTEFTGEQLDRLGELFEQGADKIRGLKGAAGGEAPAG